MPSFKELIKQHDEAMRIDPQVAEMVEAVARVTGNPVPNRVLLSTGKFTTLGEFSLSKYAEHSGV